MAETPRTILLLDPEKSVFRQLRNQIREVTENRFDVTLATDEDQLVSYLHERTFELLLVRPFSDFESLVESIVSKIAPIKVALVTVPDDDPIDPHVQSLVAGVIRVRQDGDNRLRDWLLQLLGRERALRILEEGESQLRLALQAARMAVWTWDITRDSLRYSSDPDVVLGKARSGLRHTFETFLSYVHPEDRGKVQQSVQLLLESGSTYDFIFRVKETEGEYRWVQSIGELFRKTDGSPHIMAGVVVDITRQKKAEEEIRRMNQELELRVADRTKALEETNQELEAFTYSVSHDLRVPLQSIYGFVEILATSYGDKLDAKGMDYLWRLKASAERMSQLIDDFLALSRIKRHNMSLLDVNLSLLAHRVLDELRTLDRERIVDVEIEDDIWALADERLVKVVVENLLSNAWKYTGKKSRASIRFGMIEDNEEKVYFVTDNGAGFNPAQSERLFQPFSRLHSSREFSGTGIGLATVARILERHNGTIWAKGEEGKGASFFFTIGFIPDADRQQVIVELVASESNAEPA